MSNLPIITCIGCGKRPEEIAEYKYNEEQMDPTAYVIMEEGTFNKHEKNKFYCTECFIKAGMPLNPRR